MGCCVVVPSGLAGPVAEVPGRAWLFSTPTVAADCCVSGAPGGGNPWQRGLGIQSLVSKVDKSPFSQWGCIPPAAWRCRPHWRLRTLFFPSPTLCTHTTQCKHNSYPPKAPVSIAYCCYRPGKWPLSIALLLSQPSVLLRESRHLPNSLTSRLPFRTLALE